MAGISARHDVDTTFSPVPRHVGVEPVLDLCHRLLSYAMRLEDLRAQDRAAARRRLPDQGPVLDGLWRDLAETAEERSGTASRWYHALDPLYAELDRIIPIASPELAEEVLTDPRIAAIIPTLYGLRAAFEQDKEAAIARAILATGDPRGRLQRFLAQEAYWALSPEIRTALAGCRRVLVAGSGPLPLTGLGIATGLGAEVTCLERDSEAFELGDQLLQIADWAPRMRSLQCDIEQVDDLDRFDAVVGAVLLGVETKAGGTSRRTDIARELLLRMRPRSRLVMRDPHGLGQLLYPALDPGRLRGFDLRRWIPAPGADPSYRVSVVCLRR